MGKCSKYNKAFLKSWLKDPSFEKWAHKGDLKKPSESEKHKQNMSKICSSKQISLNTAFAKGEKLTNLELQLSVYVACHSSINAIDHLCDILKKNLPSTSTTDSIRLHRTKCTSLVKKGFIPSIVERTRFWSEGFTLFFDNRWVYGHCLCKALVCVRTILLSQTQQNYFSVCWSYSSYQQHSRCFVSAH